MQRRRGGCLRQAAAREQRVGGAGTVSDVDSGGSAGREALGNRAASSVQQSDLRQHGNHPTC